MSTTINKLKRRLITLCVRPYVSRELPKWGWLYSHAVGGYQANEFWRNSPPRIIRDKRFGLYRIINLGEWADRLTYFLNRWHDLKATLCIETLLKPGDRVLDVGANYGHFTMAAARRVTSSGYIISIEPNPISHARLLVHLYINNITHVHALKCGLSDEPGELVLSVPRISSEEATFARTNYDDVVNVQCSVERGDDVLNGVSVTLIKTDTEGFESKVLVGLRESIDRCRPFVMIEIVSRHLLRANSSPSDIAAFFHDRDYSCFKIESKRTILRHKLSLVRCDTPTRDGDYLWLASETIDDLPKEIVVQ